MLTRSPAAPDPARPRRLVAAAVLALGLAVAPVTAGAAPARGVSFADPAFRQCVSGELGQPPSAPITSAQAASVRSLVCDAGAVTTLGGAQALTGLVSLDVQAGEVTDLAPLARSTRLRTLLLSNNRVRDLAPLRGLTGLTRLEVGGNPVRSLAPLSRLTRLDVLYVDGATWTTLDPLRSLTGLRRFSASQEGRVDVTALSRLTRLEQLNLDVPGVRDLAPLRSLTRLTELDVRAGAADLTVLAPLRRLRVLTVGVRGGRGAAGLAGKPDLTELGVLGLPLRDLGVLSASRRLERLTVDAPSGLRDVAALRHLPRLSSVILSGVDRADLRPLSGLRELSFLSVSRSRLGPLTQLRGFAALDYLDLSGNGLTSLHGLRVPPNLTGMDVSGNRLGDVRALGCGLTVVATGQTVELPTARVGRPYRLPLAGAPGQRVELGRSSGWRTSGTAVTYRRAGSFRVPFSTDSTLDCDVTLRGVVVQRARTAVPVEPPRDR